MITYSFMDNTTYGAEDVNEIFKRLTTQGVSLYNGSQPVMQALNGAVSDFAAAGVEMYNSSACEVVKNIDGTYVVKPGTAFFGDGSTITVIADEPIVPVVGKSSYIYFRTNVAANRNELVCSDVEGTGDFVPLATISVNGQVTDTRIYARTKLAPCTPNIYVTKSATVTCVKYSNTDYRNTVGKIVGTVDVGWSGWRYIQFFTHGENDSRLYFSDTANEEDIYIFERSITLRFIKRGKYIDIKHVATNGQFSAAINLELFIV
jgi:hypothetical protein|nr:MAG TPA: hypothetical protein [Caudoviricetes sp.]